MKPKRRIDPKRREWLQRQQKAVDSLFQQCVKEGMLDPPVKNALGNNPSLTMKRQVVTAWIGNRFDRPVTMQNIVGAGEYVVGSSVKRLRVVSPGRGWAGTRILPGKWAHLGENKGTNYFRTKTSLSGKKIWVDFDLSKRLGISVLGFGFLANGKKTNNKWKDSDRGTEHIIQKMLENELKRVNSHILTIPVTGGGKKGIRIPVKDVKIKKPERRAKRKWSVTNEGKYSTVFSYNGGNVWVEFHVDGANVNPFSLDYGIFEGGRKENSFWTGINEEKAKQDFIKRLEQQMKEGDYLAE